MSLEIEVEAFDSLRAAMDDKGPWLKLLTVMVAVQAALTLAASVAAAV
jgi:hypothetical protein